MQFGLIGEHLGHSFSKEIHESLGEYAYELRELAPDDLAAFFEARDFCGVNVTIPYKQSVMPLLDEVDAFAQTIGAVNTVVNRAGKLVGYNTDYLGLHSLIAHAGVDIAGKKVLILGTGGTSKTAVVVAQALGAACIERVSRNGREGALTYEQAARDCLDAQVIINCTPCGMYPAVDGVPVDITQFPQLEGVIDAIYNPLETKLVQQARARGIAAEGGLYMLVAQAMFAAELFLGRQLEVRALTDALYEELLAAKGASGAAKTATADDKKDE